MSRWEATRKCFGEKEECLSALTLGTSKASSSTAKYVLAKGAPALLLVRVALLATDILRAHV